MLKKKRGKPDDGNCIHSWACYQAQEKVEANFDEIRSWKTVKMLFPRRINFGRAHMAPSILSLNTFSKTCLISYI
jgi:hypothetical protein